MEIPCELSLKAMEGHVFAVPLLKMAQLRARGAGQGAFLPLDAQAFSSSQIYLPRGFCK